MMRFFIALICCISCAVLASPSGTTTGYENCIDCHSEQVNLWQQSDHYKAMNPPTAEYVLGDFSGVEVTHFSQKVTFYTKDDAYWMSFSEGNTTNEYRVEYTFGHYPLQQYLIKTDNGRMQVFPFAWDTRPKAEGGQRWYVMYPEEDIQANDRLHWQQPLQNWNGMCADCHSDGLKRNYDTHTDSFSTNWDNINVGCKSCHTDMSGHASTLMNTLDQTGLEYLKDTAKKVSKWAFTEDNNIASWQGEKRDNRFMETCYACHSLRAPITDGFSADTPFLDQFSVALLDNTTYHADGQIKEEVYVYGSFLQSKMYSAGVNCVDCHNPHTMKVKTQTNGLCLQCHQPQAYENSQHLMHKSGTEPAQCVSCHMPTTTYMGVDARRDHSFKIPRPELTSAFDIPNACNSCHVDKGSDWAAQQIKMNYPNNRPLTDSEKLFIRLLDQGGLPLSQQLALANDKNMNEIYRASAIALLPNSTQTVTHNTVKDWLVSDDPLVRLATAKIGSMLSDVDKRKGFVNLLSDELRSVRVEAAVHLVGMSFVEPEVFNQAFAELMAAREQGMWRGEGGLNKSMIHIQQNEITPGIESLKHSIKVDPYFVPSYVNLSNIYKMTGDTAKEKAMFAKGLKHNPKSDLLLYSYALFYIRQNNVENAIEQVLLAIKQAPTNPQYAYLYFLALDKQNKTDQALLNLRSSLKRYNNNPQLVNLGLYLAQKQQDTQQYRYFMSFK